MPFAKNAKATPTYFRARTWALGVTMPYEKHPEFTAPEARSVLWRYVDLYQLLYLLETETLFFCSLQNMVDPYEGRYPRQALLTEAQSLAKNVSISDFEKLYIDVTAQSEDIFRDRSSISCWHENPHESAAMWDIYSRNSGLAIKTTFQNLTEALRKSPELIFIGRVKYIDYDRENVPKGNMYRALLHKRMSFEHEREVRAIVTSADPQPNGISISLDVKSLLLGIHVSPTSPSWKLRVVEALAARHKLTCQIVQSILYADDIK